MSKHSTNERPLNRWERFMDRWMSEPERRREQEALASQTSSGPPPDDPWAWDDCA